MQFNGDPKGFLEWTLLLPKDLTRHRPPLLLPFCLGEMNEKTISSFWEIEEDGIKQPTILHLGMGAKERGDISWFSTQEWTNLFTNWEGSGGIEKTWTRMFNTFDTEKLSGNCWCKDRKTFLGLVHLYIDSPNLV